MSGLGGLNKSEHGVVIGLMQLQLPVTVTPADLARQTARVVELVAKARRDLGTKDLVVFPEYMRHGLSMDTRGGAQDCPYSYMTDLAAGAYRLPWEDSVRITDGTICGFPAATRVFGQPTQEAAE